MRDNENRSLIPLAGSALVKQPPGADRVLSAMVGESLALLRRDQVESGGCGALPLVPLEATVAKIIIVFGDAAICRLLGQVCSRMGHEVSLHQTYEGGLAAMDRERADVLMVEVRLPGGQGSQVIQECRVRHPKTEVIVVSGLTEAQTAAEAAKLGTADYLRLPFEIEHLQQKIHLAIARLRDSIVALDDLDALVREGKRLYRGEGLTEEDIQAFNLFHRAAMAGHPEAQYLASRCYGWETGVEKDEAQALAWLRKSAEAGFAEAQFCLGSAYSYGDGVPQDNADALKWYRKAAGQGNMNAQSGLGGCYAHGEGVQKDDAEAAKWYRKAAEQGDRIAQWDLGFRYQVGRGVPRDDVESFYWYLRSAEQGLSIAQCALGDFYSEGRGVPIDFLQAYKWYRLAADQGQEESHAASMAALMSPSEFQAAERLYQEFKDSHTQND